MPKTNSLEFRAAVDCAFDIADQIRRVITGPFCVEARVDQASLDLGVLQSFERSETTDQEPDFDVAIIAGPNAKLSALLPKDVTHQMLLETSAYYVLWTPAPDAALFIYDFQRQRGMMWLSNGKAPSWLLSRPLLPLIHAHAAAGDWSPVHAAAVGRDGQFLLFAGKGGSGKTTAALACASAGWDYAGDDFVIVNPRTKIVLPLFSSGRSRTKGGNALAGSLSSFCEEMSNEGGDGRYELRLGRKNSPCGISGGVVKKILLPRRSGSPTLAIAPAGPAEVFGALFPATRACVPGFAGAITRKLLVISKMSPTLSIDTGQDPLAISDLVAPLLEETK